MATVGKTDGVGSVVQGATSAIAFRLRAYRFQASSSFTALSMYVYHYPTGTSPTGYANPLVMGIYSDNVGVPNALLGQTGTKALTSGGAWLYGEGWQAINLESGISITDTTWYWLAAIGTPILSASSGGSAELMSLGGYSSTLPASYVGELSTSRDANIYASSDAVAEETTDLIDVSLNAAGLHGVSLANAGIHGVSLTETNLHGAALSDSSRS